MRLFDDPKPPAPTTIDLQLADTADMLACYAGRGAVLVFADSPWQEYRERPGVAAPDLVFPVLPLTTIALHFALAHKAVGPDARIVMWHCWPLVVEAIATMRRERRNGTTPTLTALDVLGPWQEVSGGAWGKDRLGIGVGHHWTGDNEPAILGKKGSPYTDTKALLCNTYISEPESHSAKPVPWQVDMIRRWVPPGGGVLDLYAGEGSVALAVMEAGEGRWYGGAEIHPPRHAIAMGAIGADQMRRTRG